LPILLRLSSWKEDQSFADFMQGAWPFASDVFVLMKQGDVVLFLDGLNEMGTTTSKHANELREWFKTEPLAHVVLTCRADDYSEGLNLGIPTVSVEPLNAAQIRRFAENYLRQERAVSLLSRVLPPDDLPEPEIRLWESRSLFELARNPYFLTALIYVHDQTPEGDLPRNNGRLFRMLTRALWERERILGTAGWIPVQDMEASLANLAFAMTVENRPLDVPMDYAIGKAESERLLRAAHCASLVEIRGTDIRFYHQLTQEYFAAIRLERLPLVDVLAKPNLYWHSRRGRVASRWDQVIIALSGLVDADQIVRQIAEVNVLLAGDCIASGSRVSRECRQDVQAKLLNGLTVYGCMTWASASVLAEIGELTVVPRLLNVFADQDVQWRSWSQDGGYHDRGHKVADAILSALARIGAPAVPDLLYGLKDPQPEIRHASARALGRIGSVDAVPTLIHLLGDQGQGMYFVTRVCDEAAEALGRIGTPEAIEAAVNYHAAILATDSASKWSKGESAAALQRIDSPKARKILGGIS
jgi:hypothetical protein